VPLSKTFTVALLIIFTKILETSSGIMRPRRPLLDGTWTVKSGRFLCAAYLRALLSFRSMASVHFALRERIGIDGRNVGCGRDLDLPLSECFTG